jgi:hopene-associated glycosyltransferase HpnB
MSLDTFLGIVALTAWIYLLGFRGMFWRFRERDEDDALFSGPAWPSVVAIVPARDEAAVIAQSMGSLVAQDYPGDFRIVLIDDQSSDGTAERARSLNAAGRLDILRGADPPPEWTGKLWALKQGVGHAAAWAPDYLWFTDADIAHTSDNLRRLIGRAEARGLVMVSLMAKLRCESFAERWLIPAYVFFFAMLYPFSWVNRVGNPTAAAAGGCILLRRDALERAGGIDAIRGDIIDDCALGRRVKREGPVWLGLSERALSLRSYPRIRDIGQMVTRSAYAQLGYSPLLLLGTVAGMAAIYAAPPFVALLGAGLGRAAAVLCWLCMAVALQPMLRFYRRSPVWGLTLPFIGILYTAFTLDSALQHWRGRGGMWKGRFQAMKRA